MAVSYASIKRDFACKELTLSEESIQDVTKKMLEVDLKLKKFGFSRELVCRVMQSESLKEKYGKV